MVYKSHKLYFISSKTRTSVERETFLKTALWSDESRFETPDQRREGPSVRNPASLQLPHLEKHHQCLYMEVLKQQRLPSRWCIFQEKPCIFQQDNASTMPVQQPFTNRKLLHQTRLGQHSSPLQQLVSSLSRCFQMLPLKKEEMLCNDKYWPVVTFLRCVCHISQNELILSVKW